MKTKFFWPVLILLVGMTAGCASQGTLVTTQPVSTGLSNYRSILVNVTSGISGSELEITKLETMLVTMLRQGGRFEKIIGGSVSQETPVDLRLNVAIVRLKKVSSGERALVGALAGRARVLCHSELVQARDMRKIGEFQAEGKSSGGSVFAKGTDQAIQRVAEKIVEFLYNNM
ncbi:MAG: hypothetical protein PVF22_07625 [Candidatus Aminicenantes bacterium]|jgi:hypothetical protein